MATVKFEDALARLETIVTELERGDLPLDESLKIFEEGIKLSKTCLKMLDDAERKVEILVQDRDGKKRLRAVTFEAGGADESLPLEE
jgi:exodeoxyribonuclease VII small subunit